MIATSVNNNNIEQKDTLILVPVGLGLDHKTDEQLRILESFGYQVWRQPSICSRLSFLKALKNCLGLYTLSDEFVHNPFTVTKPFDIKANCLNYSAIDQCRNKMIYNFLTHTDFKNILWIDGDIIFELKDVQQLEQSNYDIVGGTYPFKGYPQMSFVPKDSENVQFGDKGPRYVEVEALATGFLFVTRKAITNIIDKLQIPLCNTSFDNPSYPLFTPDVLSGDTYVGEDFGFCAKAKKVGYKLYLDTTIKLKHVGRYEYSWSDIAYKLPEKEELTYSVEEEPELATQFVVQEKKAALKVVEKEDDVSYNSSKKGIWNKLISFFKSFFK